MDDCLQLTHDEACNETTHAVDNYALSLPISRAQYLEWVRLMIANVSAFEKNAYLLGVQTGYDLHDEEIAFESGVYDQCTPGTIIPFPTK